MISAELPPLEDEPEIHNLISKFMIHGPCGLINSSSSCMKNNKCSKYYPKKYQPETYIDSNGFAIYKRRDNSKFTMKNDIKIDNRFIVPHNKQLIYKYEAHICVEYCCRTLMIKYLFKYISKETDRIRVVIHNYGKDTSESNYIHDNVVDEIK